MEGQGTDLGTVFTSVRIQLNELHAGIAQAKQQVRDMDRELQRATQNVERNFDAMGRTVYNVLATAFSVAAVRQFSRSLDDLARQAFESQSNLLVLANQLARTGQDAGAAARLIRELSAELRVPQEELAGAAAELLRYGYSMEQITQVFRGAAASALLMGQSTADGVRLVADALISERSTVLNTIGITENLSTAYQQYARQLGTTVDRLTAHQKAEAATQMIVKATAAEVADLETLFRGYGGAVAEAEMESYRLRQTLGQAVLPAMADVRQETAELYRTMAQIAQTPEVRAALEGLGQAMAASVREIREAVEWLGRHRDLIKELADIAIPGMSAAIAMSLIPRLRQLYEALRAIGRLPATRVGAIIAGMFALLKAIEAVDERMQAGMTTTEAFRDLVEDLWERLRTLWEGEELPFPEEPTIPQATAQQVAQLQEAVQETLRLSDAMAEYEARIVLARAGFGNLLMELLNYGSFLEEILLDESAALNERAEAALALRKVLEELATVGPQFLERFARAEGVLEQVEEERRRAIREMYLERLDLTGQWVAREQEELREWFEEQQRLYIGNNEALNEIQALYQARSLDLYRRFRDEHLREMWEMIEQEARLWGWSAEELLLRLEELASSFRGSFFEEVFGPVEDWLKEGAGFSEVWQQLQIRMAELGRQIAAEQEREQQRLLQLEQQRLQQRLQAELQITEDINRARMTETQFLLWQLDLQAQAYRELGIEEVRIIEWVSAVYQQHLEAMKTDLDRLIDALRGAGQTELAGVLAELQQQVQSGDLFLGRLAQAQIDEATRVFWEALVETSDVALAAARALEALREVTEEVTAWEQMRAGIQEAILGQLGATGQLITGVTTGNWQQAGAAGVQMLLEESEALADAFEALTEGIAALLAPLDMLFELLGPRASATLVGAGAGLLVGGPIGAAVGAVVGWLGGAAQEQVSASQLLREASQTLREVAADWREFVSTAPLYELFAELDRIEVPPELLRERQRIWEQIRDIEKWGVWPWERSRYEELKDAYRELGEQIDRFLEDAGEELQERIREALGVSWRDLASGVRSAFSASNAQEFSAALAQSFRDRLREAIVTAFLESAAMTPLWQALSDAIVGAVQDGVLTAAEMTTLQQIMEEIEGKALPFYEALRELGLAGGSPGAGGSAGTQISQITGPTRDLLVELLRPLTTLYEQPAYLAEISRATVQILEEVRAERAASIQSLVIPGPVQMEAVAMTIMQATISVSRANQMQVAQAQQVVIVTRGTAVTTARAGARAVGA